MSYNYAEQKSKIFTEQGQVVFLSIRDNVQKLLKTSGAIRMDEAVACISGDSWAKMACVDRLVELKEIREVTNSNNVAGQHRVFVGFNY